MSGDATLTWSVVAEVRPVTVSVHSMGLSFMPQQAGGGGEFLFGAGGCLASERLQMGVDEFTVGGDGKSQS